ncbi:hypothetical protein Tsubulata_036007 [Turnera subulata]|uniref:Major facilitator superfamily (MFS) profile domain-containing protein n=1 Tax=Turnera subulata TaxID=218843 RepID=A0A9Q0JN95_9ROSI|nr:hypothetical protein Tsubulata_036007 [Turnera subulata]
MAVDQEVKNSQSKVSAEMEEPLIKVVRSKDEDDFQGKSDEKGSLWVVGFSTFVAVLGSFEFGSCVGYTAPIQSAIREDLELSIAEFSLFGSILTIGSMIGAITSGHIADFIGRKRALGMAAVLGITGWVAIYFSQGALLLDAGRILTGYGIGVSSFVLMIVLGCSFAFLLGTVVTWKTLALTGIVPCLVQLLGIVFIPESPRWLAKVGCQEEFDKALKRLRGDNADISSEAAEIQDYIETLRHQSKAGILNLFQRRYLYPVTIGVGLMIFQQFGGANGICFYLNEIFFSAGLPSATIGIIIIVCIQASATGTFLGCFMAATAFLMKDYNLLTEWVPLLVLGGVLLYIGSFSIGMGSVPWVIMSEIFPINIKGAAGSLVNLVHWFGAWAVSYTFNFLMDWSSSGTFYLYSGFSAAAILFVAKVVPETKGRTLEEIQKSMKS